MNKKEILAKAAEIREKLADFEGESLLTREKGVLNGWDILEEVVKYNEGGDGVYIYDPTTEKGDYVHFTEVAGLPYEFIEEDGIFHDGGDTYKVFKLDGITFKVDGCYSSWGSNWQDDIENMVPVEAVEVVYQEWHEIEDNDNE